VEAPISKKNWQFFLCLFSPETKSWNQKNLANPEC
jgi:hypothetical protein